MTTTSVASVEAARAPALGVNHAAAEWTSYPAAESMNSPRRSLTPVVAEDIGGAAKVFFDSTNSKEETP